MSELVMLKDRTAMTTTLAIAEGTDIQHKNILELVKKYKEDIADFGGVGFQIQPLPDNSAFETRNSGERSKQGRPTQYVLLNEPQATLLMTYMSNTPVVRQFKKQLVKAFYAMAEQVRSEQPLTKRIDINYNRCTVSPDGPDIRYTLALDKFLTNPSPKRMAILSRLTGIDFDDLDELPDGEILTTLQAVRQQEIKSFVAEQCVAEPGAITGATILYAAYVIWQTARSPETEPATQKVFGGLLGVMGFQKKKSNRHHYCDIRLNNAT